MIKNYKSVFVAMAAACALSILTVGCDRTISKEEKTTVKDDGTVKSKEKTVTESPDGTVTKKETEKKTTP